MSEFNLQSPFNPAGDQPNAIKNRLKVYDELTEPLIDYYKQHGNLVRVNGNRAADEIFKELKLVAGKS